MADIVEEARRILREAHAHSLPVRLIGGLAIRMHATGEPASGLAREFKDIDLVTRGKNSRQVADLVESLGYTPDHAFNALNSGRRALFYDVTHERQLDVFVGGFEMCHKIPVADRLDLDPFTVPLAELLLTKLQIVELNEKDLRDILALVIDHDVADHDSDAINTAYIARLCADDWGLCARPSRPSNAPVRASTGSGSQTPTGPSWTRACRLFGAAWKPNRNPAAGNCARASAIVCAGTSSRKRSHDERA